MPIIQSVTNALAGATVVNVLAGSVYEYLPYNARLEFGLTSDVLGSARVTVLTGPDTVLEESPVSRQNRFPIYPDDFSLVDVAAAGSRVVIRYRNTDAAAQNLFWTLRITPV